MKIQPLSNVKILVFSLSLALIFISGCVAINQPRLSVQDNVNTVEYRSELVVPEAKAFFAFSEFRMLGAENRWEEAIAALERAIEFGRESD